MNLFSHIERVKSIARQDLGAWYYGCATFTCILLPGSSHMWQLMTIPLSVAIVYDLLCDGDMVKPGWRAATLVVALGTALVATSLVAPVILDGSLIANFDLLDPMGY